MSNIPAAVDFELASAASGLASVLRDWTAQALEDPASARYCFVVPDFDAYAGDFWEWLFQREDESLRRLEPAVYKDGVSVSRVMRDCLPRCRHGVLSVAAAMVDDAGETAGRCVWKAQWGSRSLPPEPDLEVEALRGGGFAVRWSPRAEAKADVMDWLVSFVVWNSFEMKPEEDSHA